MKDKKPKNNCTTDKFTNCMGLWEDDKVCRDTDCKYHYDYEQEKEVPSLGEIRKSNDIKLDEIYK